MLPHASRHVWKTSHHGWQFISWNSTPAKLNCCSFYRIGCCDLPFYVCYCMKLQITCGRAASKCFSTSVTDPEINASSLTQPHCYAPTTVALCISKLSNQHGLNYTLNYIAVVSCMPLSIKQWSHNHNVTYLLMKQNKIELRK